MSAFSSLFSGPKPVTASRYRTNQQGAYDAQAALAGSYAQMGANGQAGYNQYAPQYNSAVQNRVDYLKRDPNTLARTTGNVARATANVPGLVAQSTANLQTGLARRGIGGGALAGGLASIQNNALNANIDAGYNEAYRADDEYARNNAELPQFLDSVVGGYQNDVNRGLSGQGAVYGGVAQGYGQLAASDEQTAAQNAAEKRRQQQQLYNLFGSVASAAVPYAFPLKYKPPRTG